VLSVTKVSECCTAVAASSVSATGRERSANQSQEVRLGGGDAQDAVAKAELQPLDPGS
jgi:hypothetical protein